MKTSRTKFIKAQAIFFGIVSFIFLCNGQNIFNSRTVFSGIWKLNFEKSDFGKVSAENAAASSIEIIQDYESFEIKRNLHSGESSTEHLTFDGKKLISKLPPPRNITKTSYLEWSKDQMFLTVFQHYKIVGEEEATWELDRTEKYSLSPDGNTLYVEIVSVYPNRTEAVKAAYDKK